MIAVTKWSRSFDPNILLVSRNIPPSWSGVRTGFPQLGTVSPPFIKDKRTEIYEAKIENLMKIFWNLADRETMEDRGWVAKGWETSLCCRPFSRHLSFGRVVKMGDLWSYLFEKNVVSLTREENDSGAVNSRTRTVPPFSLSFQIPIFRCYFEV